jgi:hypothetical protein
MAEPANEGSRNDTVDTVAGLKIAPYILVRMCTSGADLARVSTETEVRSRTGYGCIS